MIPEPQVETVTICTGEEWDAVATAYKEKGWKLAAVNTVLCGRMTFVPVADPDHGEGRE